MSQTETNSIKRPKNVVRLKIDGAKNAVNTLKDEQTGRGLSLVCPFPALEVDIPVHLGEGEHLTEGSIHRIGVEDDPRTGLPRLRLAIRTADTRNTVVAEATQVLLDAARENVNQDEPVVPRAEGPMVRPLVSWADALNDVAEEREAVPEADTAMDDDQFGEHDGEDPGWVSCREMPLPEEFLSRSTTRRRYRIMKHSAVAFVLGMLVAAGYLLDSAGMIQFSSVGNTIASYFGATSDTAGQDVPALLDESSSQTEKAAPAVATAPASEEKNEATTVENSAAVVPQVETAAYSAGPNPLLGEEAPATESAVATPPTTVETGAEETTVETSASSATEPADAPEAVASTDITLNLPTRWPVEYATAYRVRDPNGVVVDVPGGLVRREGWLEEGRENALIRSVKAIQRESGARFIVYVNGDLPRFITSPKGNGVSLRLYYDNNGEDTTTVAALEDVR